WRHDVPGIAAVGVIAGEARAVAEVLLAPAAEGTPAACPVKPGDPYPRPADVLRGARPPSLDHADDLMTGDERQARERNLPLDNVQIGVTDAAGADADEDLPVFGLGQRTVEEPERPLGDRPGCREHVGPHVAILAPMLKSTSD